MDSTTCSLCHGNAGRLNDEGTHNLCAARAAIGRPTPSLGTRCETCGGSGTTGRGGVFLDFEHGPATIARSIAAQFPPCQNCGGNGYTIKMEPNDRKIKALAWLKDYKAMSLTAGYPRRCGRTTVRQIWGCAVCSGTVPKGSKVLKIETAPYVGAVICEDCEFSGTLALADELSGGSR